MNKITHSAIAAALVFLLNGCGSNEPKPLPDGSAEQRIQSLSEYITEVSPVGDSLMITHYHHPVAGADNWIVTFFGDAWTVMSRLDEASRNTPYRQVVFMVKLPTRDDLGRESDQLGMEVYYDPAKFKGANWKNMTFYDMMDLPADIKFKRLGLEYSVEFCRDAEHAKYARVFCGWAKSR